MRARTEPAGPADQAAVGRETRGEPAIGFMAGMNVRGLDARDFPDRVVEILKPTPIRWLRIHALPTRSLDRKGPNGLSYLDGKNGQNVARTTELMGYVLEAAQKR